MGKVELLVGNMRVEGAPSTFVSPSERVELGNFRVERQKLGEGGVEIVRGETGIFLVVGLWLGGSGILELGGGRDWIRGAGGLFIFEGCRPWWRETLTHHAEQKIEESLELKGQTIFISGVKHF